MHKGHRPTFCIFILLFTFKTRLRLHKINKWRIKCFTKYPTKGIDQVTKPKTQLLSIYLSVYLSIPPHLSVSLSLCLSLSLSLSLSISVSLSLPPYPFLVRKQTQLWTPWEGWRMLSEQAKQRNLNTVNLQLLVNNTCCCFLRRPPNKKFCLLCWLWICPTPQVCCESTLIQKVRIRFQVNKRS